MFLCFLTITERFPHSPLLDLSEIPLSPPTFPQFDPRLCRSLNRTIFPKSSKTLIHFTETRYIREYRRQNGKK